jgi:hypothetical protein
MSAIKLTARAVRDLTAGRKLNSLDGFLNIELEMTEADMRMAFEGFLGAVSEEQFTAWMSELMPGWATKE